MAASSASVPAKFGEEDVEASSSSSPLPVAAGSGSTSPETVQRKVSSEDQARATALKDDANRQFSGA